MSDLEAELWCASCKIFYAKVFRVQRGPSIWEHEKKPADAPSRCTVCERVIERKP